MKPLLEIKNLSKSFRLTSKAPGGKSVSLKAVDDISFSIFPGETLGLVGESGCGKSTTGKLVLRLIEADSGSVTFDDKEIGKLSSAQLRAERRNLQMIFQDPYSSLNPRMRVRQILAEPLQLHGLDKNGRTLQEELSHLLETVGLDASHLDRYPHQFSGGQRQRIGIARALAVKPKLIVADEPVSALDVSIQAQVINLMQDIQHQFGLTYLFIAHDLAVIEHICDRVAVMYLGRIVEIAPAEKIYGSTQHPYTEALLAAVPRPDPKRERTHQPLQGEVPSPVNPPSGCHFHPRCPYAQNICRTQSPELSEKAPQHLAACHFSHKIASQSRTDQTTSQ